MEALPESFCGELEYEGEGEADVLIAATCRCRATPRSAPSRWWRRSAWCSSRRSWRRATPTSPSRPATTRSRRPASGTRRSCREERQGLRRQSDVVGVVGTYNSGCAAIEIPILNEAPDGGVAMVSPGNTLICLTQDSPSCEPEDSPTASTRPAPGTTPGSSPTTRPRAPAWRSSRRSRASRPLRAVRGRGSDQQRPGRHLRRRRRRSSVWSSPASTTGTRRRPTTRT